MKFSNNEIQILNLILSIHYTGTLHLLSQLLFVQTESISQRVLTITLTKYGTRRKALTSSIQSKAVLLQFTQLLFLQTESILQQRVLEIAFVKYGMHRTHQDCYKGHTPSVYAVAFSPDGKCLSTGSGDNTCKIWNA